MFNNLKWNWKSCGIAAVITLMITLILLSINAKENHHHNMYWTFLWAYLTVEAWKICRWEAFYAYPGYLLACGLIAPLFGNSGIVLVILNIGGLAAFAYYLNKDQGIKNIESNQAGT